MRISNIARRKRLFCLLPLLLSTFLVTLSPGCSKNVKDMTAAEKAVYTSALRRFERRLRSLAALRSLDDRLR